MKGSKQGVKAVNEKHKETKPRTKRNGGSLGRGASVWKPRALQRCQESQRHPKQSRYTRVSLSVPAAAAFPPPRSPGLPFGVTTPTFLVMLDSAMYHVEGCCVPVADMDGFLTLCFTCSGPDQSLCVMVSFLIVCYHAPVRCNT